MTTGPDPMISTEAGFTNGLGHRTATADAAATKRSNTASASSGPGAPSGWYWTVSIGRLAVAEALHGPVVEVDLADPEAGPLRDRRPDDLDLVVLGRDLDQPELEVADRVVRAVVAEPEPRRLGARGPSDDLVSQADPEQRPAVVDDRLRQRHGSVQAGRIPGAGRQDQAVDVGGEGDGGRDRVGQDAHPGPAASHREDDVRLEPEVHDPDQRTTVLRSPDVHDRRGRHLADEVLVLPPADGPRRGDRRVRSVSPGAVTIPRRQPLARRCRARARVSTPGDGRDGVVAEERRELAGVVEDRRGRVGHDQGPEPRPDRLVVVGQTAVVADQGELTVGETVVDTNHRGDGAPNVHVALDADEARFVALLLETFARR